MQDPWKQQVEALGTFIRAQRQMADLSLRELAELSQVSNAYLSQVERGLHQPSVRVLNSIARALRLSTEALLLQAGLAPEPDEAAAEPGPVSTPAAIMADPVLSAAQKSALLGVYRSFLAERSPGPDGGSESEPDSA